MTMIFPTPISCGVHHLAGLHRSILSFSSDKPAIETHSERNDRVLKAVIKHQYSVIETLGPLEPLFTEAKQKAKLNEDIVLVRTGRVSNKCAFIVFSDNQQNQNGQEFADNLIANELGKVTSSGYDHNPNSGNPICVWVWEVDWIALQRYSDNKNWGLKVPASYYE